MSSVGGEESWQAHTGQSEPQAFHAVVRECITDTSACTYTLVHAQTRKWTLEAHTHTVHYLSTHLITQHPLVPNQPFGNVLPKGVVTPFVYLHLYIYLFVCLGPFSPVASRQGPFLSFHLSGDGEPVANISREQHIH